MLLDFCPTFVLVATLLGYASLHVKVASAIGERLTRRSTIVKLANVEQDPRATLRECIKLKYPTQAAAAKCLDVTSAYLSEILNGRPPGIHLAAKIEREFGIPMIAWVPVKPVRSRV